jgi:hypothetical protein
MSEIGSFAAGLVDSGTIYRKAVEAAADAAALREINAAAASARNSHLLALPVAAHWRADRRKAVESAPTVDLAERAAVAATLEAVARLAKAAGCKVRRSTGAAGRKSSVYVTLPAYPKAVRISDHTLPYRVDREFRDVGIVIGRGRDEPLEWTPTRWRREVVLAAGGRR